MYKKILCTLFIIIEEACARFALFLRHNINVVILSNRPQQAFTLYQTIYHNIFADQSK